MANLGRFVHACVHAPEEIAALLERDDAEYVLRNAKFGEMTGLHLAAVNNPQLLDIFLGSPYCTQEWVNHQDHYGKTFMMLLVHHHPNWVYPLIGTKWITQELLRMKDKDGETAADQATDPVAWLKLTQSMS